MASEPKKIIITITITILTIMLITVTILTIMLIIVIVLNQFYLYCKVERAGSM